MTMTGTKPSPRLPARAPRAVARGAGVALACLASSAQGRSRVLFAAYAIGRPLSKPGLQVFVVVPDSEEPWKRATVPFATSVTSWSTVTLLAMTAVRRRTRLPVPLTAVALGGAVVALDSLPRRPGREEEVPGDRPGGGGSDRPTAGRRPLVSHRARVSPQIRSRRCGLNVSTPHVEGLRSAHRLPRRSMALSSREKRIHSVRVSRPCPRQHRPHGVARV